MKHIYIFIITVLFSLNIFAQPMVELNRYASNELNDIVLMYYGASNREKWTTNQVSHFVTHTFKDGHTEWLFPAFLYMEFKIADKDIMLAPGYAKIPATKTDWQWLVDRYFAKGEGLDALNKAIQNAKVKLGEPPFKHKVILGIPTPIKGQTNWGKTNRGLNFNKVDDRIDAVMWFVDNVLNRFKSAHFENIELEGLYWIDEDMETGAELFPSLSKLIKNKGVKYYWIPYYFAKGSARWLYYGFDYGYIQPNYFFSLDRPKSRLEEACVKAKRYGHALEIEFDERHFSQRNTFGKRLEDYLDVFEKNGIFDSCALAYYCGNAAFLKLSQSRDPYDVQLLDRLSGFIVKRNKKSPAYKAPSNNTANNIPSQQKKDGTNKSVKKKYNWTDPEYWHF